MSVNSLATHADWTCCLSFSPSFTWCCFSLSHFMTEITGLVKKGLYIYLLYVLSMYSLKNEI